MDWDSPERERWRAIWNAAINNAGNYNRVARLLGYCSHNSVWSCRNKGSKPSTPERVKRLLILAGGYGDVMAKFWLKHHKPKIGWKLAGVSHYRNSYRWAYEGEETSYPPDFQGQKWVKRDKPIIYLKFRHERPVQHVVVNGYTYFKF